MGRIKSFLYQWCIENNRHDLLESWHNEKNGTRTPYNTAFSSNKYAWWLCSKCGYEWESKVNNRTAGNRGCPLCAGKVVVSGRNDLATTHPEIAKEWHPTLNGDLTPDKVSRGHGKKVWWKCPLGHEYEATPNHRTSSKNPTSCPECYSGRQTSFAEQAVFYYVKKLFPDAINRYKADFLGSMELDIYIPSIHYAIEYDGSAWHKKEKLSREEKKYQICRENHIKLIRLREEEAPVDLITADYIWVRKDLYSPPVLEKVLREVLRRLTFFQTGFYEYLIDVNIKRDSKEILQYHTTTLKDSIAKEYPLIANEWHPTKNGDLKPEMFTKGSEHKVWWQCGDCGCEWESTIAHRTAGTGCPKCARQKVIASSIKKVAQIDIHSGKIIRIFESMSEAARVLKINGANITSVCKGSRPNAGGYFWRYVDEDGNIIQTPSWFDIQKVDNQLSLL